MSQKNGTKTAIEQKLLQMKQKMVNLTNFLLFMAIVTSHDDLARPWLAYCGLALPVMTKHDIKLPYRRDYTELVLFLILFFAGSTIQNSWASPLAAATRIIQELVLFKGSYISRLYGVLQFLVVINLILVENMN